MNKRFVLRGLLVFFAAPALADDAPTLHRVVPKVGNVCTYRITDHTPYSPIVGESAKSGPDITPSADLGQVLYTYLQRRTGNSGTTTVKGRASGWEDANVAGHKSRVLRLTWDGSSQSNGDASNPRGYNGTLHITYTLSPDTPCLVSEYSKSEGSTWTGEAVLIELVSQDIK